MLTPAQRAMIKESNSIHDDLQNLLKTLAEPAYQKFASALLPGTSNLLGVRLPVLRQIAGDIAKGDWPNYLSMPTDTYFEETMLQGMVIGHVTKRNTRGQTYSSTKDDTRGQTYSSLKGLDSNQTHGGDRRKPQTHSYLKAFIPRINNWSVCDSFCAGLKFVKEKREETWPILMDCLKSDQEFEFRFGAVMLLNHYLTDDWIDAVLDAYFTHTHQDYYAKMAIAWGLSQAFAFDPQKTLTQFEHRWVIGSAAIGAAAIGEATIGEAATGKAAHSTATTEAAEDQDVFIRQKTFRKILESNKVSPEHKTIIKAMKEGEPRG